MCQFFVNIPVCGWVWYLELSRVPRHVAQQTRYQNVGLRSGHCLGTISSGCVVLLVDLLRTIGNISENGDLEVKRSKALREVSDQGDTIYSLIGHLRPEHLQKLVPK